MEIKTRHLPKGSRIRENSKYVYASMQIDPARTAFILVDVWDRHFAPRYLERTRPITENKIVPALAAARHVGLRIVQAHAYPGHALHPLIVIKPSDDMIYTTDLKDLKGAVSTLVYVGFATNMCLLHRPYGIRQSHVLGYEILLLRDATTGFEFGNTARGMWATKTAISHIEYQFGQTALTEDFINACYGTSS